MPPRSTRKRPKARRAPHKAKGSIRAGRAKPSPRRNPLSPPARPFLPPPSSSPLPRRFTGVVFIAWFYVLTGLIGLAFAFLTARYASNQGDAALDDALRTGFLTAVLLGLLINALQVLGGAFLLQRHEWARLLIVVLGLVTIFGLVLSLSVFVFGRHLPDLGAGLAWLLPLALGGGLLLGVFNAWAVLFLLQPVVTRLFR